MIFPLKASETYTEFIQKLSIDINHHISEIQNKIKHYGSFNVIANSTFRNSLSPAYIENSMPPNLVIPEYEVRISK